MKKLFVLLTWILSCGIYENVSANSNARLDVLFECSKDAVKFASDIRMKEAVKNKTAPKYYLEELIKKLAK